MREKEREREQLTQRFLRKRRKYSFKYIRRYTFLAVPAVFIPPLCASCYMQNA